MKKLLFPFEWLLLAIQYRSFKAYRTVMKEQERRKDENEPPIETMWTFKIKKFFWVLLHKYITEYWPKEACDNYYALLGSLAMRMEDTGSDRFKFGFHELRLAGSTIVIDEKWAVNGSGKSIYVHRRETKESDWKLVYRTYWLMKDTSFLRWIDGANRSNCLVTSVVEENSPHTTISTVVN